MLFDEIINDAYEPREYPALARLSDEWVRTRPFEGLKILAATPIFRNTLVQYRALIAGGAELIVGRAEGSGDGASMPCDPSIVNMLKENGVPVISDRDVKSGAVEDDFDLILDCAGQFSFCNPHVGFVELTRSGVQFYEKSPYPVYVADSGIVKRIETTLGTGEGCFRALDQLGFNTLGYEGKSLVVFGSGKVGCGIALQGVRRGMNVCTITDTTRRNAGSDFCHVLENNEVQIVDCKNDTSVSAVVSSADYVVTATGVKGALSLAAVSAILDNPRIVVANMGVEDEFGEMVPANRVLNKKAPLNFLLEEPTHLKYIDTSLALHAALGERLLQESAQCMVGFPFSGVKDPAGDLEQLLLMTTIQHGIIGPEICDMMR